MILVFYQIFQKVLPNWMHLFIIQYATSSIDACHRVVHHHLYAFSIAVTVTVIISHTTLPHNVSLYQYSKHTYQTILVLISRNNFYWRSKLTPYCFLGIDSKTIESSRVCNFLRQQHLLQQNLRLKSSNPTCMSDHPTKQSLYVSEAPKFGLRTHVMVWEFKW